MITVWFGRFRLISHSCSSLGFGLLHSTLSLEVVEDELLRARVADVVQKLGIHGVYAAELAMERVFAADAVQGPVRQNRGQLRGGVACRSERLLLSLVPSNYYN